MIAVPNLLRFLYGLLCIFAVLAASKPSSTALLRTDEGRVSHLASLLETQTVITLTDSNYTKFLFDSPRSYHAVLVLTAMDQQYRCNVCRSFDPVYSALAAQHKIQVPFTNDTSSSNNVVFFKVDVQDGRKIFEAAETQSAPILYYMPPLKKGDKTDFSNKLPMESVTASPKVVLSEIVKKTGVKVVLLSDPKPLLVWCTLLSVITALVAAGVVRSSSWSDLIRSKSIFFFGSCILFCVGVSGSIYCVLRTPPIVGQQGAVVNLFSPQSRDQYILEGVIVSGMTLATSATLILLYLAAGSKPLLSRHVTVPLLACAFVWLSWCIFESYAGKNKWYTYLSTVPIDVNTWLTAPTRKASGFWKRLMRFTQWVIFEYTTQDELTSKFDSIIADFFRQKLAPFIGKAGILAGGATTA